MDGPTARSSRIGIFVRAAAGSFLFPGLTLAASFQGLGDLPGFEIVSEATAVSADGRVVVGNSFSGRRSIEAFRWEASTGMVGLGTPGPSDRIAHSFAQAVSADGSVVVGEMSASNRSGNQAFRWDAGQGRVPLHEGDDGATLSSATAVSADGTIVVGRGLFGPLESEALRWENGNDGVRFGALPGGPVGTSSARGISGDGRVIVGRSESGAAYRWDTEGGFTSDFGFSSGSASGAEAVSADGTVVVGHAAGRSGIASPFRWHATEGFSSLDLREIGLFRGVAAAVSGDGSIVGGFASAPGDLATTAFVWDARSGVRRVDALLASFGIDLAGWTLFSVTGISVDGTVLVGNGLNPEQNREAWIAVIPEPGTGVLTALGLVGLALRPRRERTS